MSISKARVVLVAAGGLLLAGCAGAPVGAGGDDDATNAEPSATPSSLVGLWVVDAPDEEDGALLQIGSSSDPASLTVWRECGSSSGTWVAAGSALLMEPWDVATACTPEVDVETPWLADTRSYAVDGETVSLLDAGGGELATLTPDSQHEAGSTDGPARPELDDTQLTALDEAPPVPDGVEPAAADDLVGTWVPGGDAAPEAEITLDADGTYTGSDGCNGTTGRWAQGEDGRLLVTAGVSTMMACDGMHLVGLAMAAWAEVDGDTLTLYDVSGAVVDEAVRG
jgi:hypothetical protein